MTEKNNGIAAAIEAGKKIGEQNGYPKRVEADWSNLKAGEIPAVILPQGATLESLEAYMPRPARLDQMVALEAARSFIEYVNAFKDESTRVFASVDEKGGSFTAIIDYHKTDKTPRRKLHTVRFRALFSEEWKTWMKTNKQTFTHTEFAEYIEENLSDIIKPDPASVLESVRSLQINREVNFDSVVSLTDGKYHFNYVETDTKKSGQKGEAEFPHVITLNLPVFAPVPGETEQWGVDVSVRIQYILKRDEGRVGFKYSIVRPHKIVEFAFVRLFKEVEAGLKMKVLLGIAQ